LTELGNPALTCAAIYDIICCFDACFILIIFRLLEPSAKQIHICQTAASPQGTPTQDIQHTRRVAPKVLGLARLIGKLERHDPSTGKIQLHGIRVIRLELPNSSLVVEHATTATVRLCEWKLMMSP
jgi:hypothetical protein